MLALSRPLRVTFIFLPCYVIICSGQEQASRGNTPRFASTILLICWSPRTDTLVNNLLAYIITTGETCPASSIPDRSNRRVPRPTYIVRTFISSRDFMSRLTPCDLYQCRCRSRNYICALIAMLLVHGTPPLMMGDSTQRCPRTIFSWHSISTSRSVSTQS